MKYGDSEVEALGQALVKTIERETALLSRVAEAYPVDHAAMLAIVHLRDQLTKANARVATLEAECVAWRKLHVGTKLFPPISDAVAATGPIGGVA